jgi:hypothetical protein
MLVAMLRNVRNRCIHVMTLHFDSRLAGSLILVGLATPIAAAVGGVTVLCTAAPIETHIVLATIGVSLALLGPGAWSIDARLYGRRRRALRSHSEPGSAPNMRASQDCDLSSVRGR